MKRHKKVFLWLMGILLTQLSLPAQGTFQKTVGNLGHCNGQTILDDGALRFGGHSNSGPQETIEQTIAEFPNPNDITREAYAMVYYIKDLQGNIIFRSAYLHEFPWAANHQFRDLVTNDQSKIDSIEAHAQFIANAGPTEGGHDYDLMAYKSTLDLDLSHQRLFGSPLWLEQWQFGQVASIHRSMIPQPTGEYFVGASAQQILGTKTHVTLAKIDNSHQLLWNTQIEDIDPSYPGHLLFREGIYLPAEDDLLVHGFKGWFPSRVYWLDAVNGSLVRSREYDVNFNDIVHGSRTYGIYMDHVIQEDLAGNDDLNFVAHTVYRDDPADVATVRLVFLRTSRQGIAQVARTYTLNGEQLFGTRIHQQNSNSFLVTGEIRNMTTLESDGLLMEIDHNGIAQWAKRIHFASHEETRDVHFDFQGNIWVFGETNAYQSNPQHRNFALYKFDGSGNLLNAHYYLKTHDDEARSLLATGGGDFIMEGIQPWGIERYYLRTDPLGKGPNCSTVEFEPTVTNAGILSTSADHITHQIEHLSVSQPTFTEQDFVPVVNSVDCTECNCDQ